MEVAVITGKTKQEVRITKPVGGLLIKCDQLIKGMGAEAAGWENEELSVRIESGQSQVKIIPTKTKVAPLAIMSTLGEGGMLIEGTSMLLFIPIALGGSLDLENKAEIVVNLDILKSAKTYTIYGLENPGLTRQFFQYENVKVLSGRTSETFDTTASDLISISSLAAVEKLEFSKITVAPDGSARATNHEFEQDEIKFLMAQINDTVAASADGSVFHSFFHNSLVLPASMITQLSIETDGSELDVILRRPMVY